MGYKLFKGQMASRFKSALGHPKDLKVKVRKQTFFPNRALVVLSCRGGICPWHS